MGVYAVCEKHGRLPQGVLKCPQCEQDQYSNDKYSVDIDQHCAVMLGESGIFRVNLDTPCPYCGKTHSRLLLKHKRVKIFFKQYYVVCPETGKKLKPFYLP